MEQNYESEKQEAQKRFDSLPENLKKELLADKTVELIHSVCQDYSIPEEKIKHVTMLVGEVFLGYTKPEEIAHELTTYFDIDLQKANFIEIELKQKLFNGLKTELDKIYNPIKLETDETVKEEVSPTIISLEKEATPITSIPSTSTPRSSEIIIDKKPEVKISPLTIGDSTKQPVKTEVQFNKIPSSTTLSGAIADEQEKPFIIQTKVEAVKAAIPQFPKETPSLNLKVDPSIIQKSPVIKPVSIHLETTQPVQEKKFQMPVIAGQKVFGNDLNKPSTEPIKPATQPLSIKPEIAPIKTEIKPQIGIKPIQTNQPAESKPINLQGQPLEFKKVEVAKPTATPEIKIATPNVNKVYEEIKIPIQQKTAINELKTTSSPSLKEVSEQKDIPIPNQQKPSILEPQKVVHYSTFKTDLTHLGTPKKPEPKKEDFINLNTFMRVSGNTVDLRKSTE